MQLDIRKKKKCKNVKGRDSIMIIGRWYAHIFEKTMKLNKIINRMKLLFYKVNIQR